MSPAWTLCIDFGTAYSKAAAAPRDAWAKFNPARVRPLMLNLAGGPGNAFLLDSAVFVDDARILFARDALVRAGASRDQKRSALRSFKTLLSVSDLERALNTAAPASIDPNRNFMLRDLVVLYIAFLTAAVARAVVADPELAGASFDFRYAAPAWRSGDSAGAHQNIVRLFGEAEAVREALGETLLGPEGVTFLAAQAALASARTAGTPEMGLIFEATAAAAYSSIGLDHRASHLVVVDMGAGTTDFAALAEVAGRVSEIPSARVTIKRAGDFIDGVIANIALDAHRALKPQQKNDFWRVMMRDMHDFKETLFADGKAVYRYEGKAISVSMKDLERDADFRDFSSNLDQLYEHSFAALSEQALADGEREVHAIAVGGGASAPFIQDLIRRKPRSGKVKVQSRSATPEWAHAPAFRGNLAPVFPQLAIAIGGALAPESMVAARAALILDAAVQTGSRPAPD